VPSIERYIIDAVLEVFATMIFIDIKSGDSMTGQDDSIDSNLTSMIGLAGDLQGVLAVHCPESAALGISGAMLGMTIDAINDDVLDAIGEIANMVAGGLKTSLDGDNITTELAIPTTVLGKAVRTSGQAGGARFLIPFATPVGDFGVELKYVLH